MLNYIVNICDVFTIVRGIMQNFSFIYFEFNE